tara:strand:- start:14639 stop:15118 length:480 start_codon:yes stop_codon:yes gene_type:complete
VTTSPPDYYRQTTPSPYPLERSGVDQCFGCSTSNDKGLGLVFSRYDDGTVETTHLTQQHHCGFDTVIHGGIQAAILDEVMGVAAQSTLTKEASDLACATAEMKLSYLRPAFLSEEVTARAWVVKIDGRDIYVDGVLLSSEMVEVTTATSRWRQMRYQPT